MLVVQICYLLLMDVPSKGGGGNVIIFSAIGCTGRGWGKNCTKARLFWLKISCKTQKDQKTTETKAF